MSSNTHDHYEWFDDYGEYPPRPGHPPQPGHPPRPFHPPRPSHRPPPAHPPRVPARDNTELVRLRSNYRWLRRSMTLIVLAYFIGYLCMAAYLPGAMGTPLFGSLNLGVFLGLMLIPLTILTVLAYELIARSTIDPAAHRVRIADAERREGEESR